MPATMAWSVAPWTLAWPRMALMPPPGRPMLPSSSCMIAALRMFWLPTVCMVQPTAYMIVPTRSAVPVEVITFATSRNFSLVHPAISATTSGV